MPHKRAKRSIRESETAKRGSNLTPSAAAHNAEYDDTPRSASRILNSWKVQSAFRESGRVSSEDTGERRKGPKGPKGSASAAGSTSASASASGSGSGSGNKGNSNAKLSVKGQNGVVNPSTGGANGKGKEKIPSILPHESLAEYNRRIEDLLRPGLSKAISTAASIRAAEESAARREKKDKKKRARIEKLVKDGKMPKEALEKLDQQLKDKDGKRKREGDVDGDSDDEGEGEGSKTAGGDQAQQQRPEKHFAPLPGPRRLNDIVQAPPQLPHLRRTGTAKPSTSSKEAYAAVGDSGRNPLNMGQRRILEEERERVVNLYREMKVAREGVRAEEREKEKVREKEEKARVQQERTALKREKEKEKSLSRKKVKVKV